MSWFHYSRSWLKECTLAREFKSQPKECWLNVSVCQFFISCVLTILRRRHAKSFNLVAKSDCNCSLVRQNGIKLRKIGADEAAKTCGRRWFAQKVPKAGATREVLPAQLSGPDWGIRPPGPHLSFFLSLMCWWMPCVGGCECRSGSSLSQCEKDETMQPRAPLFVVLVISSP